MQLIEVRKNYQNIKLRKVQFSSLNIVHLYFIEPK